MLRREKRLGFCFALVCLVLFLRIIFTSEPLGEIPLNQFAVREYTKENFIELVARTYGTSRLLDTLTYDHLTYVEIRDEVVEVDGRKEIRRIAKKDNKLMTCAYLKFPSKLTRSTLDTRKWEIDVYRKPRRSQGAIVDELFASGALSPTPESSARVLTLGLGGGFLNTYLHHAFPQMSITAVEFHRPTVEMAKKWFSLEPDNSLQVVIEDGVLFLEKSALRGRPYNAVILDACFIHTLDELHCPSTAFLNPQPIKDMAKVVGEQGVLIVDVFSNSHYPESVVREIEKKFLKYFKYSKIKHVEGTSNYIITFTQFKHKELYTILDKAFLKPSDAHE
ncbi:hypothetical protein GCK32_001191 [Trichostrongylus colubriformis]|uniref:Uncharacterized protein n=1 Tax=Trichostrongylus colubriformis TaxID=6319 RepID=A0AAN8FLT1_TRICO